MTWDETKFSQQAEKQITECRPGDWEHAKRVAFWVKKLAPGNPNLPLLIATAYIHDIGWRDLLSNTTDKLTKKQLLELEPLANANSKTFATQFLETQNFSSEQINTILNLIAAADKHKSNNENQAIIVDADNLSKLTIDHLKQKYQPESWMEWCHLWKTEYPNRIQTQVGKKLYPDLLSKLEKDIKQELSK
jgi:hypothetical protein